VNDVSEIRFHAFAILDIYGRKVVEKLLNSEEVDIEGGKVFHQGSIYQAMAIVKNSESAAKLSNLIREAATEYFIGVARRSYDSIQDEDMSR